MGERKLKAQWTKEALNEAMATIDDGYKWKEVCTYYCIQRTCLRDHMSDKTKSRNMDPSPIFTKQEHDGLLYYLKEMVELEHPLNSFQLKTKVVEMTQLRMTPFRIGIPSYSWLKWFRIRNPWFILREPQPLDSNRAKALCPSNIERFYSNLASLYTQYNYQLQCV